MHQWSFAYAFFGRPIRVAIWSFFRRIEIRYHAPLPLTGPLLFAPNHSNALADAIVTAYRPPRQVTFLARADIFAKPRLRAFFQSIKMLPIYRTRDGVEQMAKNDETFQLCADILRHGETVLIFPEGNHSTYRKLRPLKKGLARIAFQAEESADYQAGVRVVPVGLYYHAATKFDGELLIQYGPHIETAAYVEKYRENPAAATRALSDELARRMKQLIIHIDEPAVHTGTEQLWSIQRAEIRRGALSDLYSEFHAHQRLADGLTRYYRHSQTAGEEFLEDNSKTAWRIRPRRWRCWQKRSGCCCLRRCSCWAW